LGHLSCSSDVIVSGEILKRLGAFRDSCRNRNPEKGCHMLQLLDLARPFLVPPAIKMKLKAAWEWLCLERKVVVCGNLLALWNFASWWNMNLFA
jgi:hypothetical protein